MAKLNQDLFGEEIEEEKIQNIPGIKRIKRDPLEILPSQKETIFSTSRLKQEDQNEEEKVNETLTIAMSMFTIQVDTLKLDLKEKWVV